MPWTIDDVEKHKKGLSDKQKKQWVRIANSALSRCMAKGGTDKDCAASAIQQASGVVNANVASGLYGVYKTKQLSYEPKLVTHQEKPHLVIPVVMMVEGVHNGSLGPLLHTIEDLGKFPGSWNGIPVVIYHPEIDGEPVSANSPEIIDTRTVGRVYNTSVEGKKLKAEVWLDEDKLNAISEETLAQVNSSKEMEVSLGMFTENDMTPGKYGDEDYDGTAHNHHPDHLAILPDQIGACSCADGCGLGVSAEKDTTIEIKQFIEGKKVVQALNKEMLRFALVPMAGYSEAGYREKMDAVYQALRGLDNNESYHYLEEMYDDSLIYNKNSKDGTKMYKQDYKFESGKIELIGNAVEVHKKVDYVVNMSINLKKEDEQMSKEECTPCIKKKVDDLIANSQGKYTEDDREMLQTLSEAMLDKIAKPVEVTKEVNKLTPEQQADLAYVAQQRAQKRTEMIQGIQTNTSKDLWPDEVLNKMNEDNLKRIFDSVKKEEPTTYLGGGRPLNSVAQVEMLPPAGIEVKD